MDDLIADLSQYYAAKVKGMKWEKGGQVDPRVSRR
jgi:hypothetical protein